MCLQKRKKEAEVGGRWDPREFAKNIIVPWNQANQRVLGASADPYVSNPLRRPRADQQLDQLKYREEWTRVCDVLRDVDTVNDKVHTKRVFVEALSAIRDRLRELTFVYPVPPRVSLEQASRLIRNYLSVGSGGDRGLAVAAALFQTFATRLGIYQQIRRGVINAADVATNAAGDLECLASDGSVALAVEVKERQIGDDDVQIAVTKARELSVRELVLCTEGVVRTEQEAVAKTVASAWAGGTNIYHVTIDGLIRGVLPLLGENAVREFVVQIGSQLDQFSTQPRHRKDWRSLLDSL